MDECIRVMNLSKNYHKKNVVRSINFHVDYGQIFAFLGPNGAGKSTTMNMISTLIPKSGGSIYIDGMNLDFHAEDIKRRIGIVFQDDVLDDDISVYQNLFFRGGLYINKKQLLQERIEYITSLLSLEDILYTRYKECSGGQRRLAQLARAILPMPRLLILDEPTTGLDPVTREHVWHVLIRLKEQLNMTIFFTTHYMEEGSYADNICVLNKGSILLCDSLDRVRTNYTYQFKDMDLNDIYLYLLRDGACL